MKKIFFTLLSLLIMFNTQAINDTTKLIIKITPLDQMYIKQASSIYTPLQVAFSPSMQQSLDITTSTYNAVFYYLDKVNWTKIKNPFLRPLVQTAAFYTAVIGLTYLPFGDSWLHEEFHRSILTYHHVKSHDQVYDFPLFSSLISVNDVKDDDLVNFKASAPQDFIRLHEAGIEGEYLLINRLNQLSFFYNQGYPYYITELLTTLNTFYYVWMCHTQEAEKTTNDLNKTEVDIKTRDFTGLDFTAWVYDLFRPYEPYQDRGLHPTGTGIDRYRKPSDLTQEELAYLKRQGYMELINFISPFLLNINSINIGNVEYNFAFRYFLTSFGSDMVTYNYLKHNRLNLVFGTHFYKNYDKIFTGLELNIIDYSLWDKKILLNTDFQIFTQPENLNFTTPRAITGFFFLTDLNIKLIKHGYLRLRFMHKTQGWVPGIIDQERATNLHAGVRLVF